MGVNRGTLHGFIEDADIPAKKGDREKMGLVVVSKGAQIYRESNARAKEKGWKNWHEYQRAVNRDEVEVPWKKDSPQIKPRTGLIY